MIRFIILTTLIVTPALAKDFTVTDQEQADIAAICEAAARSPAIPVEANARIAAWCVQWKGRIQAANTPTEKKD